MDAEAVGGLDHAREPDHLGHADGRDVVRVLERLAERHDAVELAVVVDRAVGRLARVDDDRERAVEDGVGAGVALLERRQVDEGLERRSRLAHGLRRAVELGLRPVGAADHRADGAARVLDDQHGALLARLLVEGERRACRPWPSGRSTVTRSPAFRIFAAVVAPVHASGGVREREASAFRRAPRRPRRSSRITTARSDGALLDLRAFPRRIHVGLERAVAALGEVAGLVEAVAAARPGAGPSRGPPRTRPAAPDRASTRRAGRAGRGPSRRRSSRGTGGSPPQKYGPTIDSGRDGAAGRGSASAALRSASVM